MSGVLVRRILRNDLRLFLRGQAKAKAAWAASTMGRLLLLALLHLPAWGLMYQSAHRGASPGGAELACLLVLVFVFLTGVQRTLVTLWDRGDLPLLLASPVPARVVVLTRLLDVLVTSCVATGFLVIPLVDVACLVHGPHWLWGLVAWPFATLAVAPLALLVTLWTVAHFGVRRARGLMQVLSLVLGMGIFLFMQAPRWGGRPIGDEPLAVYHFLAAPPLTWLVAAARGDLRWLLLLTATGTALLFLAARALAAQFTLGVQAAAGEGAAPGSRALPGVRDGAWGRAFRGHRGRSLAKKELLLVRRDPFLLARCTTQLLGVFPLLVGFLWTDPALGLVTFAMLGPPLFAVTLAVLMTVNDEAHELVAASPIGRAATVVARTVAAATIPALVGWTASAIVLVLGPAWLAATAATCVAVNCAAMAAVGACTTRPFTAEERARGKQPSLFWQTFVALLLGGLASGGATACAHGSVLAGGTLLAIALACALLVLGLSAARVLRRGAPAG